MGKWRSQFQRGKNNPSWKGKNIKRVCKVCGKEFEVWPSFIKRGEGIFCSNKCKGRWRSEHQKNENNPLWNGGSSREPYSIDWTKTLRRSIRERDHYTCQLCGELQSDITFSIHHIDYNKKNCNPENLLTLCISCHLKTNINREYWKEFFIKRRK